MSSNFVHMTNDVVVRLVTTVNAEAKDKRQNNDFFCFCFDLQTRQVPILSK